MFVRVRFSSTFTLVCSMSFILGTPHGALDADPQGKQQAELKHVQIKPDLREKMA